METVGYPDQPFLVSRSNRVYMAKWARIVFAIALLSCVPLGNATKDSEILAFANAIISENATLAGLVQVSIDDTSYTQPNYVGLVMVCETKDLSKTPDEYLKILDSFAQRIVKEYPGAFDIVTLYTHATGNTTASKMEIETAGA